MKVRNAAGELETLEEMRMRKKADFDAVVAAQKALKKEYTKKDYPWSDKLGQPPPGAEWLVAGGTAPFGYWDPVGFSTGISEGRLLFYREAELKHGRICMLAFLGFLVGENYHPLLGGVDVGGVTHFIQHAPKVELEPFWKFAAVQNFAAIAYLEITRSLPQMNIPNNAEYAAVENDYVGADAFSFKTGDGRIPGDLGFDPLNIKNSKNTDLVTMQSREINNSRLAMIGMLGIAVQELITGKHVFGPDFQLGLGFGKYFDTVG